MPPPPPPIYTPPHRPMYRRKEMGPCPSQCSKSYLESLSDDLLEKITRKLEQRDCSAPKCTCKSIQNRLLIYQQEQIMVIPKTRPKCIGRGVGLRFVRASRAQVIRPRVSRITKGGGGMLSIIVLGAFGDLVKKKTFHFHILKHPLPSSTNANVGS